MNIEKLKRLQAQVRIGGKGTPRRKKKVMHQTAAADDKKLQSSLKKLSVSTIPGIEEVNIIKDDLTVIHFNNPKAQASLSANTFAVTGHGESKKIVEMLPEILPQLGQETVVQLRMFANSMTNSQKEGTDGFQPHFSANVDEDDVPLLVSDFDEIAKNEVINKAKTRPIKEKIQNSANVSVFNAEKLNVPQNTSPKVESKKQTTKKQLNEKSADNNKAAQLLKEASMNKNDKSKKDVSIKKTDENKSGFKPIEIKTNIEKDNATESAPKLIGPNAINNNKSLGNNLTTVENLSETAVKSSPPAQSLNLMVDPLMEVKLNEENLLLPGLEQLTSTPLSENKKINALPLGSSEQEKPKGNENIKLVQKQLEHSKLEPVKQNANKDCSSLPVILSAIQKGITDTELKQANPLDAIALGNIEANKKILQSAAAPVASIITLQEKQNELELKTNTSPRTTSLLTEKKAEEQQEIQNAANVAAATIQHVENKQDIKELQAAETASVLGRILSKPMSTTLAPNIKTDANISGSTLSSLNKQEALEKLNSSSENNKENTQNKEIQFCEDFPTGKITITTLSSEKQIENVTMLPAALTAAETTQTEQQLRNPLNENKLEVLKMSADEKPTGIDLLDANKIQSEEMLMQIHETNVDPLNQNNANLNAKPAIQTSSQKKYGTRKETIKQQPATAINAKKPDNVAKQVSPLKPLAPQTLTGAAPKKQQLSKPAAAGPVTKQDKSVIAGVKQAATKPQNTVTTKSSTISPPKNVLVSQSSTEHPAKVITPVKSPPGVDQTSSAPAKPRPDNNNLKGKKIKAQTGTTDLTLKQTQPSKSAQKKLTEDPDRAKVLETAIKTTPTKQKLGKDTSKIQAQPTDSPNQSTQEPQTIQQKVSEDLTKSK